MKGLPVYTYPLCARGPFISANIQPMIPPTVLSVNILDPISVGIRLMAVYARPSDVTTYECISRLSNDTPFKVPNTLPFSLWGVSININNE